MAIDGIITQSKWSPFGVRIHLGPRKPRPYLAQTGDVAIPSANPVGQEWLDIQDATWQPHIGDEVWGGSDRVFIVSGGVSFPYRRVGYTRLVQDWQ